MSADFETNLFAHTYADSVVSSKDSQSVSLFRKYSAYLGIGFPLGIGGEFAYRPFSSLAIFFEANAAILIPYLITAGHPSFCFGISTPLEKIHTSGFQSAVFTSLIVIPAIDDVSGATAVGLFYGTMLGSLPIFNWKFGAMLWLRDHGSTFLSRIEGLPLLSISFRIY